ncbi:uncharacterized protein LOC134207217 [Armigeres subalbatus]|uniref:uncharacterized protein LOC134207217 n=1 Tax=Armigeres subalbatus TaxID=124917 RepID=UPI002ED5D67E
MMWSGFRDIINPISNALGVVVNSHNMRDFVNNTAQNIKKIIRSEVSEKIICLKVDAASKLYRSVLGVNCQYMLDGVIELFERHTGENLCKEVFKLTTEYGIQKSQIFSVTVDNGANMIKMIKSMNECVSKEFFQEDGELPDDEIINEMAVDPDELEAIDYATNNLMENLEKVVIENGALCVRCGAHTLQLVVNEVCKAFDEPLKGIAKIAKKLRCGEFKRIFEITKGVKLPHIPVKTRWNTNYVMLRDFLEQKEFFINLGSQYKESDLTQYWHFIENYVEAFEPIYEATIIIQKKDCSLSELYYHWQKALALLAC